MLPHADAGVQPESAAGAQRQGASALVCFAGPHSQHICMCHAGGGDCRLSTLGPNSCADALGVLGQHQLGEGSARWVARWVWHGPRARSLMEAACSKPVASRHTSLLCYHNAASALPMTVCAIWGNTHIKERSQKVQPCLMLCQLLLPRTAPPHPPQTRRRSSGVNREAHVRTKLLLAACATE